MTGREPEVLDALLRRDLTSFTRNAFHEINPGDEFLDNWHIARICWHLSRSATGARPNV
jgi:hypothetical protein